jgi:hypothetical protein
MSAVFMVADTKGGKGGLSTGKIAPAMKTLHGSANGHHDRATDAASFPTSWMSEHHFHRHRKGAPEPGPESCS